MKDRFALMASPEKKKKRLNEKRELKIKFEILSTLDYFNRDQELYFMRSRLNLDYMSIFASAYKAYKDGNWSEAQSFLTEVLLMKPGDGPTNTLLNFMSNYDFHAPDDWSGYRELTDK